MENSKVRITGENAADRITYIGEIFSIGEKQKKNQILSELQQDWSDLHRDGYIHIHDLEAYGLTYNCLALDLRKFFPYKRFLNFSKEAKIIGLFDFLKEFLSKLGNEQSGGMAFANFDIEVAAVLEKSEIPYEEINEALLRAAISSFIIWCNNSHERMGKVSYYISLNLGLADSQYSRFVCNLVLDEYEHTNAKIYKPNIIFKVKAGINLNANDQNYYLFQKALRVTTIKMIPTYVLCDSKPNKDVIPQDFAIMGCRTRVVADKYGKTGSMERGNIAYVTINLPRIALEISKKLPDKLSVFLSNWGKIAETTSKILEHRYYQLVLKRQRTDFRTNSEYDLWCESFRNNSLGDIFKHGTLAIGFIGLSEAVEIFTGKKYYEDVNACKVAVEIATYMRNYIDHLRDTSKFNYSLLATSGEFISGKFLTIDKSKGYSHRTMSKGYYTNSFHIDVSAGISAFEKIAFEAPFHELCNGGCITYIELKEAPLNNELALEEIINFSISQGIHYLGFNYNLDICNDCDTKGVFDACPECGCSNITRIRRVSGYLEILDYFTEGKKHEEKHRKLNKIKK